MSQSMNATPFTYFHRISKIFQGKEMLAETVASILTNKLPLHNMTWCLLGTGTSRRL